MFYSKEMNKKMENNLETNRLRIEKYAKILNAVSDQSAKERTSLILFLLYKKTIKEKCSLGYSKEEITNDAKCLVNLAKNLGGVLALSDIVDVISIDYIFKFNIRSGVEFSNKLEAVLSNCEIDVYEKLLEISLSGNSNDLANFMNNEWYSLCSTFDWYDSEGTDYFDGYWSFVAAAIAKSGAMETKDIKYIPNNLI